MPATDERICYSCRDDRLNAGKRPRTLVELATKTRGGKSVYACEFCDGPAVERSSRTAVKRQKRSK